MEMYGNQRAYRDDDIHNARFCVQLRVLRVAFYGWSVHRGGVD